MFNFDSRDLKVNTVLQESKRHLGGLSVLGVGSMVEEIAQQAGPRDDLDSDRSGSSDGIFVHYVIF